MQTPGGNPEYLELAEKFAAQATQLAPGAISSWRTLAQASTLRRNSTQAIAAYNKCIELRPNVPTFHLALTDILLIDGQIENSSAALDRMESLFDQSVDSTLIRIRLLVLSGRKDEGMILLGQCRQRDPQNPRVIQLSRELMGQP